VVLARPSSRHASMGMLATAIRNARSGVPSTIRTGRWRWPRREAQSKAASGHGHQWIPPVPCRPAPVRIRTSAAEELPTASRDLKSKNRGCRRGRLQRRHPPTASPGDQQMAGARRHLKVGGGETSRRSVCDRHPRPTVRSRPRQTKQPCRRSPAPTTWWRHLPHCLPGKAKTVQPAKVESPPPATQPSPAMRWPL